ncbi:MAG TPA: hypothetical protein VHW23_23925 [Kofleriaceae bacterium]|jgi:hypothetical protein|nr:hypothetical protein [Kofleriaceae bacterium]
MRPLLLAVLLLSCAGDETRHAPAPAPPVPAAPVAAERAPAAVSAPPPDPRATTRLAAHDALAEHCGACHEGHRSSNAKALAVFDLDQLDWPSRFTPARFESALRRLAQKPEPARAAFVAFRDAELAARPD